MILTGRRDIIRSRWFFPLAYGPGILGVVLTFMGMRLLVLDFVPGAYGIQEFHRPLVPLVLFSVYAFGGIGYSVLTCLRWGIGSSDPRNRKIALIVAWSGVLTIVLVFWQMIVPAIFNMPMPSGSHLIMVIWMTAMTYVIVKYRLMALTPALAAEKIVSTMADALALLDPDGRILDVNPAFTKILGFSKDEAAGRPFDALCPQVDPACRPLVGLDERHSVLSGLEMTLTGKDGRGVEVNLNGATVLGEAGERAGAVITFTDISERARHREETQQLQARLQQNEKMAAVGRLAGGVAHEINNPMGIILGFSQALMKRIKPGDEMFMPLESIEREAQRCKALVRNMLMFSRQTNLQRQDVDVPELLAQTLMLVKTLATVSDITVRTQIAEGLPMVSANADQLEQVVLNLCNNALDAMKPGGVLTVGAARAGGELLITVADTGSGISEAARQRIFEPFFTTKEVGKGTGLGLSLSYEIIKNHGGSITFTSRPGETVFTVHLPV
jgi:PAS domain S-box-containing protein